MIYWGIDPGPSRTGIALIRNGKPTAFCVPTLQLTDPYIPYPINEIDGEFYAPSKVRVGIEMPEGMGQVAGKDLIETIFAAGQMYHSLYPFARVTRYGRKEIKRYFGVTPQGKSADSQIRSAMIERWGEPGTAKNPGPTYGITGDAWAALAVATCVYDKENANRTASVE